MKRKSISLIIGLMSVALLGVMAVQVYFMKESYRLKTELFNQSVNAALSTVASKLEKQDAFNFLDIKEREQQYLTAHQPQSQWVRQRMRKKPAEKPVDEQPIKTNNASLPAAVQYMPDTAIISRIAGRLSGRYAFSNKKQGTIQFSHKLPTGIQYDLRSREVPKRVNLAQGSGRLEGGLSSMVMYDEKADPWPKLSRLIQSEQSKADSLFQLQDSFFRKQHPDVFVYHQAKTDENLVNLNFRLEGVEYEDEDGRIHRQITKVVPQATVSGDLRAASIRPSARKDSIANYLFVEGSKVRVMSLEKPRIQHINLLDLQKLEEDFKNQNKEASRVTKFVESKVKTNKNAVQDLFSEFQQVDIPLSKRIMPYVEKPGKGRKSILDSLLRAELKNRDIDLRYEYKVSSARKDSVIFNQISTKAEVIPENTYQTRIFPKDIVRDAGLLTVTFPNKNAAILSKMGVMMGSSGSLLLVLLFCFGYTLHSILKQKKISEMKTDFINNMTHEFKTPVATIMIASEALRDPEITEDQSRIRRLAGIIYDENVRLGNHIERVLNIAKIDKEDLKLEHKPVEMNDLVSAVTDSMSLQLQKKNAHLTLDLAAQRSVINGDELHLSNVIFNLVDNAIKYSRDEPEIAITTLNSGKNLVIRVADKGIGMNRDQLTRIFEQFYRIPTGNLHDVKGFGLGLSYVSNIVKKLHGTVKAKSEKDKGSEFEIILPLAASQQAD